MKKKKRYKCELVYEYFDRISRYRGKALRFRWFRLKPVAAVDNEKIRLRVVSKVHIEVGTYYLLPST